MSIEIRDLHKSFGAQKVLDGLSLSIQDGKTTAIVGPSGVGKSVLLKIILGMYPADSGNVEVNGVDVTKLRSEKEKNRLRSDLGVLFQGAALFDSLSLYDNIAFPLIARSVNRKLAHDKVCSIANSLSLTRDLDRLPQEVSLGVRKRAGLARALITEPKTMLFDEPNTGLDPLVGQEVYDLIATCREKWAFTAIVISHELPEVFQISSEVAMLLNGKVIFKGNPDQFKASTNQAVQQFLHGRVEGPIQIQ